ncbi:cupin domain-containing protein [Kineobactrum salinum]|uniref:Cupin domain-containing protein n=1 Tax=Kineobactrum salinum TaxID=2708301 RepID=A0A6C0U0J1_9GAMM|nr:cupin domain-containing protein [Kineobactrum salinum]QIB65620.1 cupin domain-containing protein [Kineobactrum salinum]
MSETQRKNAIAGSIQIFRAHEHHLELPPQPDQAHRADLGTIIDYRLQETTGDSMRAIATLPGHFRDTPQWASPWHYHECELQVALIIDGSLDIDYGRDGWSRANRGDLLFIPGLAPHNVGGSSADYQVAEITFPGTFSTVETEAPQETSSVQGQTLAVRDAFLETLNSGVSVYRYKLGDDYTGKYAIRRIIRRRSEPFKPAWCTKSETTKLTFVMRGSKEFQTADDKKERIGPMDILLSPPGVSLLDTKISPDYEAIEITVDGF